MLKAKAEGLKFLWNPLEVATASDDKSAIPSPRAGHSFTYNPHTQRCLVFGGANHEQGLHNDLYLFDTVAHSWEQLHAQEDTPHRPSPRYEHASIPILHEDSFEMIILFGAGVDGPLNDIWSFNPATKEWSEFKTQGKAPSARVLKSVGLTNETETHGSRLFVFGGGLQNNEPVMDLNMYCLDLDRLFWVTVSSGSNAPAPRLGHTLSSIGTSLYLFGGISGTQTFDDLHVFDTLTNSWSCPPTNGSIPPPRCAHTASVINGKIYIYGGMSGDVPPSVLGSMYCFDPGFLELTPETMQWDICEVENAVARLDHDIAVVLNEDATEQMMVFGGMDLANVFNDVAMLEKASQ